MNELTFSKNVAIVKIRSQTRQAPEKKIDSKCQYYR